MVFLSVMFVISWWSVGDTRQYEPDEYGMCVGCAFCAADVLFVPRMCFFVSDLCGRHWDFRFGGFPVLLPPRMCAGGTGIFDLADSQCFLCCGSAWGALGFSIWRIPSAFGAADVCGRHWDFRFGGFPVLFAPRICAGGTGIFDLADSQCFLCRGCAWGALGFSICRIPSAFGSADVLCVPRMCAGGTGILDLAESRCFLYLTFRESDDQ